MSGLLNHLLELTQAKGVIRPSDLTDTGIARQYLSIACRQGLLERIGRGLYCLPNAIQNEHRSLIEVCKRVLAIELTLGTSRYFSNFAMPIFPVIIELSSLSKLSFRSLYDCIHLAGQLGLQRFWLVSAQGLFDLCGYSLGHRETAAFGPSVPALPGPCRPR